MAKRKNTNLLNNQTSTELSASNTEDFKTEKCKILLYNKKTKELDIDFKGYGIRLFNIEEIKDNYIFIKYQGEINEPNFKYNL